MEVLSHLCDVRENLISRTKEELSEVRLPLTITRVDLYEGWNVVFLKYLQ